MTKPFFPGRTGRPRGAEAARRRRVRSGDAFFRHLVAGMRNGVLATTADGRLAHINDEACRIFGLPPGTVELGQPIARVLQSHPDVVRVLTGAFDLHHLPNRVEMRLKPSGRVIGYTLAHVRDDAGVVIGAAMFFKDLTRVEQLEERDRLRDRLAAVGQMAAFIAHEVKNRLAGIEVMAGLLRRKISGAHDAQAVLTNIITDAKGANAIVQEVLDFVRPIRLQVERTHIGPPIRQAVKLAESKSHRGDIEVAIAVPSALPQIEADQHQLTQLFTNLLINAFDAMEGRGRVEVSARAVSLDEGPDRREGVLVEIRDTGPGIAPDVKERVFEPFYTTKAQGSGLGLAIVRKIVDAHDGRIDLETAPGAGTCVRVTLPVKGTDEA